MGAAICAMAEKNKEIEGWLVGPPKIFDLEMHGSKSRSFWFSNFLYSYSYFNSMALWICIFPAKVRNLCPYALRGCQIVQNVCNNPDMKPEYMESWMVDRVLSNHRRVEAKISMTQLIGQ